MLSDGLRWKQDVWKSYKQEQDWATLPSVEETEEDLFVATAPQLKPCSLRLKDDPKFNQANLWWSEAGID